MNPTRLVPPLPSIEDVELLLEVHTHRELRPPSNRDSQWDSERLADLGAKALDAVVTYHFFEQRPWIAAEEIALKRSQNTSPETLNSWLDLYDLKRRLRVPPDQSNTIFNEPEEMRNYFYTYIGAICATKGLAVVQTWISKLIDPASNPEHFQASQQSTQDGIGSQIPVTQNQNQHSFNSSQFTPTGYSTPSTSYGVQTPSYGAQNHSYSAQNHSYSTPLPPAASPPPLPSQPLTQTPLSGPINFIPLSLVNQTAVQKGYSINYVASQEGPPHQPTWTIRCLINNNERGVGRGKNQKLAKEEAARRAWLAMEW